MKKWEIILWELNSKKKQSVIFSKSEIFVLDNIIYWQAEFEFEWLSFNDNLIIEKIDLNIEHLH